MSLIPICVSSVVFIKLHGRMRPGIVRCLQLVTPRGMLLLSMGRKFLVCAEADDDSKACMNKLCDHLKCHVLSKLVTNA